MSIDSITVSPSTKKLKVGDWFYGASISICSQETAKPVIKWSSDNIEVAAVNAETGYINAKGVGISHIYATVTDGNTCTDFITVIVEEDKIPIEDIKLDRHYISMEIGETTSLNAKVVPKDAFNNFFRWSSSDEKVAIVNSGKITAVSSGYASIKVTGSENNYVSDRCDVYVAPGPSVSSVRIHPQSLKLCVGQSVYLNAIVNPYNATETGVEWSSDTPQVASIDPSSGLLIANSVGETYISAISLSSNKCGDSILITVCEAETII